MQTYNFQPRTTLTYFRKKLSKLGKPFLRQSVARRVPESNLTSNCSTTKIVAAPKNSSQRKTRAKKMRENLEASSNSKPLGLAWRFS
jgi:hypothetical protein